MSDKLSTHYATLAAGDHGDPFAVLGPHSSKTGSKKRWVVRTFQPDATAVSISDAQDVVLAKMRRVHEAGIFVAGLDTLPADYRLSVEYGERCLRLDDPYRFASPLGEIDRHLFAEGQHWRLYDKLGAHTLTLDGVTGAYFAVWAPNASRVSVVGSFNNWDGRRHPMRKHHDCGIWDIFIPGLAVGDQYKFELKSAQGTLLPLKADPCARQMEAPPGNAAIVHRSHYVWNDQNWLDTRQATSALSAPLSIYEVHLGSWRRDKNDQWLSYRDLAEQLVSYAKEMGYTHLELLPVTEHPFDGSWGYQPIGLYAPTWRFGEPDDFKYFIDRCHQAGLGVIMDWVPAHFPKDTYGLARFDGTALYEHADPRQAEHPDWGTLVYNFGRHEVANFLLANALFWLEEYHIDGLRVDAVASMLYLDYSRQPGQWVPNQHGGNENLEAVAFLRRMNELVHEHGGFTIAEESTAWPQVSRPTYLGGLGFSYKWNMGWMHDTLNYMQTDPVYRRYHHNLLTFGMMYAYSENFVLPLSHDEVVHGKGSLLTRMRGDTWQQFANLRAYLALLYAYPGKKLLFMGGEFAQGREWNHDGALDWSLLEIHWHAGVQQVVRDLNRLYTTLPALHQQDCVPEGFEWIDCNDQDQSVITFLRRSREPQDVVIIACNFTPLPRYAYQVGVPVAGVYQEIMNTDAEVYAGSGIGNAGQVETSAQACHGRPDSLYLTLPPLAVIMLQLKPAQDASG